MNKTDGVNAFIKRVSAFRGNVFAAEHIHSHRRVGRPSLRTWIPAAT